MAAVSHEPGIAARIEEQGAEAVTEDRADFVRFIAAETERNARIAERAGIMSLATQDQTVAFGNLGLPEDVGTAARVCAHIETFPLNRRASRRYRSVVGVGLACANGTSSLPASAGYLGRAS